MKTKLFFFLTILIFGLATSTSFLYFHSSPDLNLLSPFLRQSPPPDLTDKLSTHLSVLPPLDYSQATTISTISPAINYLVFDPQSQHVYLAKNQDQHFSPASFTKLLTTMVALDVTKDDPLISTTPDSINKEPTVLGLKENEQLPLSELVRGAIATSANDAAATIADGVAAIYNQPLSFFISLMNQKAALLGLTDSHFANPEGYDDSNQYSTLADIAHLVYAVNSDYPLITSAGQSDMQNIEATDTHGFYYLPNWNGLLGVYPGVFGLKIAYTEEAGYSTIVTATRNNLPIVAILSGADSIRERDLAAAALLDAAYIQRKVAPANITRSQVDRRYQQWNDLAKKIRAELKALEESSPQN